MVKERSVQLSVMLFNCKTKERINVYTSAYNPRNHCVAEESLFSFSVQWNAAMTTQSIAWSYSDYSIFETSFRSKEEDTVGR